MNNAIDVTLASRLVGGLGLVAVAVLQACSEPDLRVQLKTAPPDDPLASVAELEVVITAGARELDRQSGPASDRLELPSVEWQDDLTIYVAGLSADGELLAHGSVAPDLPGSPTACCVAMCFCSEALHRNSACGCGNNACRPTCD